VYLKNDEKPCRVTKFHFLIQEIEEKERRKGGREEGLLMTTRSVRVVCRKADILIKDLDYIPKEKFESLASVIQTVSRLVRTEDIHIARLTDFIVR
jgi:hypothetical protein